MQFFEPEVDRIFDWLKIAICSSKEFRRSRQTNWNQKSKSKSITRNGKYFPLQKSIEFWKLSTKVDFDFDHDSEP